MLEFLSINFLPNAVYKPDVCIRTTFEAAREYNFPIEKIIFEVTEGERVQDRPHLVTIFQQYRNFDFRTAIDDFGAGYASLNLLSEYQPDILKIDMGLIRNIDTDKARQAIVKGIALIGQELDIQLLAEGIETRAERDFLFSIGIDLMQGYWFSKPLKVWQASQNRLGCKSLTIECFISFIHRSKINENVQTFTHGVLIIQKVCITFH